MSKSLGPEISNNHSLYPTALLVRLQDLRVEWLAGASAGMIREASAKFPAAHTHDSEAPEP